MPQGRSIRLHQGDNISQWQGFSRKERRRCIPRSRNTSCSRIGNWTFLCEGLRQGKWELLGRHWIVCSAQRTVHLFGVAQVLGIWNGGGFWKDEWRCITCKRFELYHKSNRVSKGFKAGVFLIRISFWQNHSGTRDGLEWEERRLERWWQPDCEEHCML